MADVFVSYARSDKARVAPLVAAIVAQGWSVWWDPEIDPGQEFDRLIAAELKAAAVVLVVWTPDSVTSRWVRGEARDGADRGILVPVRFEAASLPIDVRALHTTDLDDWGEDPRSPQLQEVLRAVGAIINRDRAPKPAGAGSDPVPSAGATEPAHIAICVLPFANLSGDPQQDYFSDGITEDIITELSRWRLLAVRSRSAAFRYRGVAVDMKQVARELDVRFIVEGSVRRMGARIRINAQLIDSESGSHIWAEKFDRDLAELFTVQDQVVQTIVSTLVGRVQASDCERVRRKPPTNLAAYECVLKGNALPWEDPNGAAEAARLFEKAIEIDPGYGPRTCLACLDIASEMAGRTEQLRCRVAQSADPGKAGRRIGSKREHLLCYFGLGRIDAAVLFVGLATRTAIGRDESEQPMECRRHGRHSALCRPGRRGVSLVHARQGDRSILQ